MIEVGSEAPEFTLLDQDENEVSLSDFRGRKVVLAFYPMDFSSVCSDQFSIYQEVLPGDRGARGDSSSASASTTPMPTPPFARSSVPR